MASAAGGGGSGTTPHDLYIQRQDPNRYKVGELDSTPGAPLFVRYSAIDRVLNLSQPEPAEL